MPNTKRNLPTITKYFKKKPAVPRPQTGSNPYKQRMPRHSLQGSSRVKEFRVDVHIPAGFCVPAEAKYEYLCWQGNMTYSLTYSMPDGKCYATTKRMRDCDVEPRDCRDCGDEEGVVGEYSLDEVQEHCGPRGGDPGIEFTDTEE
jgi:hypothetical protein